MCIEEKRRQLDLFGIPGGGLGAENVRTLLSRILEAGALTLSDMQLARDVVERLNGGSSATYLILAAMLLSLKDGNTFLRSSKVSAVLKAAAHMEDDASDGYDRLIDECWGDYARSAEENLLKSDLVVCKETDAADRSWFFAKVFNSVKAVSDRLKSIDAEEDIGELPDGVVERAVRFKVRNREFSLNSEQRQAVRTVGRRRLAVITGGPGTGKTTVVCAILHSLMEQQIITGKDVALVAPTGRAGQRIGESLRMQCESAQYMHESVKSMIGELSGATVHSVLGGFPPNWKYTKDNRLPYKLVIVDEASMVDVHLMKALLEALADNCRLVLMGDKDQLPSVDAGAVLGDAVASFNGRTVVELKHSNRFTGALAECARAVNTGDAKLFADTAAELPVGGSGWLEALSDDAQDGVNRVFRCKMSAAAGYAVCRRLVVEWCSNYGLLGDGGLVAAARAVKIEDASNRIVPRDDSIAGLFKWLDRSRILTAVRQGPFGACAINEAVAAERFRGRGQANPLAEVGVPVIVTRNTPERNLWNGDIGVTVMGPSGMAVLFPRGEAAAVCPVALLPKHELAYAMTVHKSQGSEFENVMLVLPNDERHPLLNRQIVYTGITRAKRRAVVVGTEGAVMTALSRKIERDTGLGMCMA